ncbi:MAG: T9SS type A sorting domain-containing protein, partial [Bacteroidota bacterium]
QVGPSIDISPASIGNNSPFPTDFSDYDQFYDFINGGDHSQGHTVNPHTGMPYDPQMVPLGDYARILAEFWADGPDSEAPPGHWYTILNYVMDHPDFEPRWKGQGPLLDQLEYDIKAYFTMGGAMHDAAIAAWGVKGWYDYIRPLSSIRCMAEYGQCTDELATNYHPAGIPLVPGYIETVEMGDPLAGGGNEHVGKIKLYTWGGPQNITYLEPPPGPGDPVIRTPLDSAGVSWILAETWRPYQRPTFTTPPFAGYVSGHSTYSRAAAEVMTLMTGDAYFPGGMGEFHCPQNDFLVFEVGPSIDVTLQWATYRDASDQCSLSRIWGGIHPPADDIPGRIIGEAVGIDAFNYANEFIDSRSPQVNGFWNSNGMITDADNGNTLTLTIEFDEEMDTSVIPTLDFPVDDPTVNSLVLNNAVWLSVTQLEVSFDILDGNEDLSSIDILVYGAMDLAGNSMTPNTQSSAIDIDTYNPSIVNVLPLVNPVTDANAGSSGMALSITYDDTMDTSQIPAVSFPAEDPLANTLSLNAAESFWQSNTVFVAVYDVLDANEDLLDIDIDVSSTADVNGNAMNAFAGISDLFDINMTNPSVDNSSVNANIFADAEVGAGSVQLTFEFDAAMNTSVLPSVLFPNEDPLLNSLSNPFVEWTDASTLQVSYDLTDGEEELYDIDVQLTGAQSEVGNLANAYGIMDVFSIDTKNPLVTSSFNSGALLNDNSASTYQITVVFDEPMDVTSAPNLVWINGDPSNTLVFQSVQWMDSFTAEFDYNVVDNEEVIEDLGFELNNAFDVNGNEVLSYSESNVLSIEMENPDVLILTANTYDVSYSDAGTDGFTLLMIFDETMDENSVPSIAFPDEDPSAVLTLNAASSEWINATTFIAKYNVDNSAIVYIEDVDLEVSAATDLVSNMMLEFSEADYFDISVDWNTTDILEIENQEVRVYPNPIMQGEQISIDLLNAADYNLRVYSFEGKEMEPQVMNRANNKLVLSSENWSKGTYAIHLFNDEEQMVLRIVVQ